MKLSQRIQAAERPSRELDVEILSILKETFTSYLPQQLSYFTSSLDAKLPNENVVSMGYSHLRKSWFAEHISVDGLKFIGWGKTEVLARRAAAMNEIEYAATKERKTYNLRQNSGSSPPLYPPTHLKDNTMAKATFRMPDLSNATPEFLVDEMGKLSLIENHAKKMRKVLREALFARIGYDSTIPNENVSIPGEMFQANIGQSHPMRFDQAAFKEDDPDTYQKYCKEGLVTTARFTLNEGQVNPEVSALVKDLLRELNMEGGDY